MSDEITKAPDEITLKRDEKEIVSKRLIGRMDHGTAVGVFDDPGDGGACHEYAVAILHTGDYVAIPFQKGPLKEAEPNGIFNEDLLEIVADRLRGFQSGKFACAENAKALGHVEAALSMLAARTRRRQEAGVEGTHKGN